MLGRWNKRNMEKMTKIHMNCFRIWHIKIQVKFHFPVDKYVFGIIQHECTVPLELKCCIKYVNVRLLSIIPHVWLYNICGQCMHCFFRILTIVFISISHSMVLSSSKSIWHYETSVTAVCDLNRPLSFGHFGHANIPEGWLLKLSLSLFFFLCLFFSLPVSCQLKIE